ncbi:MAG TPA: PrsW family glutamic-type intramembrane protease [Anaeromyxobacteraceae bacterium]|nr:PrsW family glutamic-type intramembrane protease [Anaeromyxobacteraceae bacterium]
MTYGLPWLLACAALGGLWILAANWRAESTWRAAVRGVLGGLAALGTAAIGYEVLAALELMPRWEAIAGPALGPAVGFALLVGGVEELAKLAGVVLAAPAARSPQQRRRAVVRTTASVAAVFALAEAALALPGASWPVALSRAALGPVAHALLAAPFAVALADATGVSPRRLALRVAIAVALAAALHAAGDWSIAHPGWGQVGFAAALLAPALWLFLRARRARAAVPAREQRA